jgi:hypothetical protein
MPQVQAGWFDASAFALQPQKLGLSEVDDFLAYLFSFLAKKPPALLLRECASVSRYLEWLGWQGVPSKVLAEGPEARKRYFLEPRTEEELRQRRCLGEISRIIWGNARQYGKFRASTKVEAIRFLKKNSETYLSNPYLEPAMELLRSSEIPPETPFPFVPPNLMSRHSSGASVGRRRVKDDLSDRIYAAYHALPTAGLIIRSRRIAAALSESKAKLPRTNWTYVDVNDRVKKFEKQERRSLLARGFRDDALTIEIHKFRRSRADFWIQAFTFAISVRNPSR